MQSLNVNKLSTQMSLNDINDSKSNGLQEWLKSDQIKNVNDQKAARNDDAMIETCQWNWYLMHSYIPKYQFKNDRKI
jgi:hypothetical protein